MVHNVLSFTFLVTFDGDLRDISMMCWMQGSKMQDINMSPSGNSLELPFYPMGIEDPFSNPKQGVSTFRDFMHRGGHSSKIRSSFGDEETFYNIKDKNENIWNGNSLFTSLTSFPFYILFGFRHCNFLWLLKYSRKFPYLSFN